MQYFETRRTSYNVCNGSRKKRRSLRRLSNVFTVYSQTLQAWASKLSPITVILLEVGLSFDVFHSLAQERESAGWRDTKSKSQSSRRCRGFYVPAERRCTGGNHIFRHWICRRLPTVEMIKRIRTAHVLVMYVVFNETFDIPSLQCFIKIMTTCFVAFTDKAKLSGRLTDFE